MGGANNKRRKEKDKLKDAQREAAATLMGFRYSSCIRADQPQSAIVVRRLGSTGEFVKDHAADKRIIRKGAVVRPEVLREAFIVQNFQFILRPECFYSSGGESYESERAREERSELVAQGLVDDFPTNDSRTPISTLRSAITAVHGGAWGKTVAGSSVLLNSAANKIHWRHIVAVSTRLDVDDIRCPICFESPTAPRVTPCGHIFCFHCILRSMNAQKRLGIGYNGGQTPASTTMGVGASSSVAVNTHGSSAPTPSRPRTCPLCGCGIDLQGLRPCFIQPSEPLTEEKLNDNSSKDNTFSFTLTCRSIQSNVMIPAGGIETELKLEELSDAKNADINGAKHNLLLPRIGGGYYCGGAQPDFSDDLTPPLVASTLLSNPFFVPTYGTSVARFARYAHATSEMLRTLLQTEVTDVERSMRVLTEERPDPLAPLDEGEEQEEGALRGVYHHLTTYGYSTITTANCEGVSYYQPHHHRHHKGHAVGASGSAPTSGGSGQPNLPPKQPLSAQFHRPVASPQFVGDQKNPSRFSYGQSVQPCGGSGLSSTAEAATTKTAGESCSNVVSFSSTSSPLVWLYRLSDGQNVYLHPLNVRMLLRQAELDAAAAATSESPHISVSSPKKEEAIVCHAAVLPPTINVRILDLNTFTQPAVSGSGGDHNNSHGHGLGAKTSGRSSRIYGHVPPHAALTEAFVELSPPLVSKAVAQEFKQQIAERVKEIYRKRRRAEGEARLLRDEGGTGTGRAAGAGALAFFPTLQGPPSAQSAPFSGTVGSSNGADEDEGDVSVGNDERGARNGGEEEEEWWDGCEEWEEDEEDYEEERDADDDFEKEESGECFRDESGCSSPLVASEIKKEGFTQSGIALPAKTKSGGSGSKILNLSKPSSPTASVPSWVDENTITPEAVAAYGALERQQLVHPDEVRGTSIPSAAAAATATAARERREREKNPAVSKEEKTFLGSRYGCDDDAWYHDADADADDDDCDDYYCDDDDGCGTPLRGRHRHLQRSAAGGGGGRKKPATPSSPFPPSSAVVVDKKTVAVAVGGAGSSRDFSAPIPTAVQRANKTMRDGNEPTTLTVNSSSASSPIIKMNVDSCIDTTNAGTVNANNKKRRGKAAAEKSAGPRVVHSDPLSGLKTSVGNDDGIGVYLDSPEMIAAAIAAADAEEAKALEVAKNKKSYNGGAQKEDDMLSLLAAMGDLTEEEQMWLLQEQERELERARGHPQPFETPALQQQWGATKENNEVNSSLNNSAPSSIAPSSWGKKAPSSMNAEAFPDLMGLGLGSSAASSAGATGGFGRRKKK